MKTGYKGWVIAGVALGLCLPLMAEPGDGGTRERKKDGDRVHARLSEEGRAIMKAHHAQQREQRKARMEEHREQRKQHREALKAETDSYKQLDLIEANVRARQEEMAKHMEEAQQAHLAAYAEALGASGIEGVEREQILGRMLVKQQEWQAAAQARGEDVLAEIARLRATPDLTTEAVREAARSMMEHRKDRRKDGRRDGEDRRKDRGERGKSKGAAGPQAEAL